MAIAVEDSLKNLKNVSEIDGLPLSLDLFSNPAGY
jgi:hypothetical protein